MAPCRPTRRNGNGISFSGMAGGYLSGRSDRMTSSLIRDLLAHVTKEDLRLRFFDSIKEFSHQFIAKLTQLDYARAMAFVAIDEASSEMLGVVWLYFRPNPRDRRVCDPAEIGPQGQGLGLGP